jgi:uncharacterized protein
VAAAAIAEYIDACFSRKISSKVIFMFRIFACDPGKRERLASERGIDLYDIAEVFDDPRRLDYVDSRRDYGETRRVTIGRAMGFVFTVVYTMRGDTTWLITAWPANRKERERYDGR